MITAPALAATIAASSLLAQSTDPAPTPPESGGDDIVVLSPFEVVTDTRGYYAANTMSGTRFNTSINDLASSISILTKGQMEDFAMLDINDVFLYTSNVEGTGTYTDVTIDRNGSISDNVQLDPASANRVRGISSANIAFNNVPMQNRMPIDPIMVDAVEISRGPNASVFGLGNPSGTVNQVGASANLQENRYQVKLRADDWDGYRESMDLNQVVIPDKLGVRFSQVYDHQEWVRKPSGTDAERYNFMVKYRPFRNTTISGGYYYYKLDGTRPNSLPPRDGISYWRESGSPTWDPITRLIHVNGQTLGPYGASNGNYNGPAYFSSSFMGSNMSQAFVNENGTITHWTATGGTTGATPSTGFQANRFLQPNPAQDITSSTGRGAQPLFLVIPSVSDKSIYDWETINISAPNYVWDKDRISTVQVDQIFLNTARQTLAAQFTFLREDSERFTHNHVGIANDLGFSGMLTVDPNERLLDGSPNPYLGRPYIGAAKPRTVYSPWKWDTYRTQAAYKFDFTQEDNALKWLGVHQLTGYHEYKYRVNRNYSMRETMVGDVPWIPAGTIRGNQSSVTGTPALINATTNNFRYYVGDNQGYDVDYAPAPIGTLGTYPYTWGNVLTGVQTNQIAMGWGDVTDSTSGTNALKRTLKTRGGVLQSHFLSGALVTTIGIRDDRVYDIFGRRDATGMINPDGLTFNRDVVDAWDTNQWTLNRGRTENYQVVARPFQNFRYFQEMKGLLGDLLSDMSIGYSESDSFLPESPAQDIFFNKIPNSTGEDESWTARFRLLDDKVVVSVTRYKNMVLNARNGDASVFNQRLLRHDFPVRGTTAARYVLYNVAGAFEPNAANYNRVGWIKAVEHPEYNQQQVNARLAEIMGIPFETMQEYIDPAVPMVATNDIEATGTEVEVAFNPTTYWTVAFSGSQGEVVNRNASKSIQDWIDQRMPIWTTIKDPSVPATPENPNQLWWKTVYPGATGTGLTAEMNFESWIRQPYAVYRALEGQANPQYSKYRATVSTNFRLSGITDHPTWSKFNVGGAVRYQSKAAIGYYGVQQLPDIITDVDVNRPIWDDARYYFDAFVGYKTKLFDDRIGMSLQLNVRNLQESGELRPVGAYPDGTIHTYRIVDPRQFILTATFDF